ncbi:MAG: DUF3617 family protein [Pseudomonadales bacterium]
MQTRTITLAIAVLLIPMLASGAKLTIKPGLWESTMTRTNPMTGDETTETTRECIEETVFEPSEMLESARGCELVKNELNGNTLNFRMHCSIEGTESTLDGRYYTDGDTGEGDMTMTMSMGGRNISMNMSWTAKRLDDC